MRLAGLGLLGGSRNRSRDRSRGAAAVSGLASGAAVGRGGTAVPVLRAAKTTVAGSIRSAALAPGALGEMLRVVGYGSSQGQEEAREEEVDGGDHGLRRQGVETVVMLSFACMHYLQILSRESR